VARVHNDFLETAVDLGVIGLGFLLWLIAEGIKTVRKSRKDMGCLEFGISAGLACILGSSMFGFPLRTASTALLFWAGMGFISHRSKGGRTRPVFPGNPALISGGAAVLLLFALFHTFTWFAADTRLKKAMEHESRQEWEMMRIELEKSIKYYYPEIDSHNRLAGAYIRLEDIENAYVELNSLLELHPNHSWAHRALGQIYLELNQHEAGLELLERAARLNPAFISYLGRAHLGLGNAQKAESELLRQLKLGFADEYTYAYLGEVYEASGEADRALRAYRRALEIKPGMKLPSARIRELDKQTKNTGEEP
jgi:Tfp pilus assembly protein PilF